MFRMGLETLERALIFFPPDLIDIEYLFLNKRQNKHIAKTPYSASDRNCYIEFLVICINCLILYSQCSTAVGRKWRLWSCTLELNCWPHCVIHRITLEQCFSMLTHLLVSMIYFRSYFALELKFIFHVFISLQVLSALICVSDWRQSD